MVQEASTPRTNRSTAPKFLRWAGSKTRLLPKILGEVPSYNRYVEPFCGSAAVFFGLRPQRAILSDANSWLVTTFVAVRDQPEAVFEQLQRMEWSKENYYAVRDAGLAAYDTVDLAARFIFLNANCFNGLFRTNRSGHFNVPYGGERAGAAPSFEKLSGASQLLRGATIECCDFESCVRSHVISGDLVYLDPPFAIGNYRAFHQYRYDDFGVADIERLAALLCWIDQQDARFILSYAASPEADVLARGWRAQRVARLANIAGFRDRRRSYEEVLITNG